MDLCIDFRKLIGILNIDAPVHLTPRDNLNKHNYVLCKIMGEEETRAVIDGTHNPDKKYNDEDLGLYFPDVDIDEYLHLENGRNPMAIKSHIDELSCITRVYIKEYSLAIAIYTILHEYGHWIYFLNSGKTSYEYCEMEKSIRQPYEKAWEEIYKMHDLDPMKRILGEKYNEEIYSQFPSEKFADDYAKDHFLESLKIVRNALGYDEQDLISMD